MKILFLTMNRFTGLDMHNIYSDLMECFIEHGHKPYIVTPRSKSEGEAGIEDHGDWSLLKVATGELGSKNLIEKGIATVTVESRFKRAIRKYYAKEKFDLILYSTPPITLAGAVSFVKRRDRARTYLMLKDIFPQNSVDLGMMTETGIRGLLYKYFRNKEKQLYTLSDTIGCMSKANCNYIIGHNTDIDPQKVEICPNAIKPHYVKTSIFDRNEIRRKFEIPEDKTVFLYGGNLGKPQNVPFIIECIKACNSVKDAYFVVVGSGVDYELIKSFYEKERPDNLRIYEFMPKQEFDTFVHGCDVGLVFLDYRFTIPNFPSRILSYMEAGMPIITCTDTVTDVGDVCVNNGFGWACESDSPEKFRNCIKESLLCKDAYPDMGVRAVEYLNEQYNVEKAYQSIVRE
ncbi:MAG: glycosyltransferase family 4 protein [Tannerellaceae bacterium]|nr:glycosyltransferase family 4 protein [Tannerellaceae bacterium]